VTVSLDGNSLTIADVFAVAVGRERVDLAPAAKARMGRTRAVVEKAAACGEPVYGVTTGFGKLSDVAIEPAKLEELQVNLVRSHVSGVGPLLPEREVRGMMLLRANVIAKGFSGARADLAELLCGMLNAGIHPPVPEQGSAGASGDLAPLAHLALAMIGEGTLILDGKEAPAAEVLRGAGLAPLRLQAKEGITLINGTQAHTAVAALLLHDSLALWETAHAAGAMSLDALLGTPAAFDERIHDARGQEGQKESAALLRRLIEGSEIRESHRHGDSRVQDAYALRCMPQVHGPARDALRWIEQIVEREINAATDNPLVFENGDLLSGGNFHGQSVAMALDLLAIALTNLATISERRIDRLVHPDMNQGLPPFLTANAGLHSGMMMAQVTAASVASECKVLSHPASVDTIPTDGGKEDVVPMAMGAAWKARRVAQNLEYILAIELMCGAQGLDFRAPLKTGTALQAAHRAVRELVPHLGDDRALNGDIALLAAAVAAGKFTGLASQ